MPQNQNFIAAATYTREQAMRQQETILIADDSKGIRDFLIEYILKPKGFQVIVATNGRDGLNLARKHHPQLMIVDNQMPYMTGLELLQTLHQEGLRIPAILMTAHGSEQIAIDAFRLGIRDYVIKPFLVEEMNAAIDRALRETRLEKERSQLIQELTNSNNELKQRLQELNTVYATGKSVTTSLDLEEVLRRVVEAAIYVSGAEEGSLMLLDKEKENELYVRASKNLDSASSSMRLRIKDSLAGQVINTRQPIVIDNNIIEQKITTAYLVKSVVYVPIITQDKAIGVLSVANRRREQPFNNRDTRVLSTLADYAAIAINNAEIFTNSEQERGKLSTILGQTNNPVIVIDDRELLILANMAAQSVFNLPQTNLTGTSIRTLIQNPDALNFMLQPVTPDLERTTELSLADNLVFQANLSLIENVGRSIVLHNITQLKELDKLKSEFVAIVSHDLRSPLTAILGYVELLERVGPLNEDQTEFVNRVKQSVDNITNLISDLLDIGRLEAGIALDIEECDLPNLLNTILDEFAARIEAKQLQLKQIVSPKRLLISGDHKRLHQAFTNLISNAVKYTPEKGAIGLQVTEMNGQAIVEIADTGVGIASEDIPHIFDKFYRAKNVLSGFEGTGLGLSIVKSVIERHNGRIWVNSQMGKGTVFSIILPLLINTGENKSTPTKNTKMWTKKR
ncbi:MAG: response regulator [Anaerolineae bacterium]|nr:response regulator [Anaerolineae bacterium]